MEGKRFFTASRKRRKVEIWGSKRFKRRTAPVAPQVSNGVTIFFVTLVLIPHPHITAAIIRFLAFGPWQEKALLKQEKGRLASGFKKKPALFMRKGKRVKKFKRACNRCAEGMLCAPPAPFRPLRLSFSLHPQRRGRRGRARSRPRSLPRD